MRLLLTTGSFTSEYLYGCRNPASRDTLGGMATSAGTAPFALPVALVADLRLCASGASVTVRGEVDVHTAPLLRRRLAELVRQGEERIVVLLDDVTFMDTTGLGVLVGTHKAQLAGGGVFELVCVQPRLLHVLALTGLDQVLDIRGGSEAAAPG